MNGFVDINRYCLFVGQRTGKPGGSGGAMQCLRKFI
jgi:hypothetical protein